MSSSHRKKDPLNPRRYLWQMIKSSAAHGSIPCWGLPFEAIAASLLLKDRHKRRKPHAPGNRD
jgi:hypothetical protein